MKNSTRLFTVFIISFSLMYSGCKGESKTLPGEPAVLATVNGVKISTDALTLKIGDHEDILDSAAKSKIIDGLIAEELMFQQAEKLGFTKDPKFLREVRMMQERITAYERAEMGRRVRDTQIASHVAVTDQEVSDYYTRHANEFGVDLRLGVLQFNSEDEARAALSRIKEGMPFEKVAAEQFSHASKGMERAWDKGFLHWNQMPPAFTDEVYRLKKGEVSDVLNNNPSESFLVKVLDMRRNSASGLEEVKPLIESRLWAKKGKEAYAHYIEQLKRDAAVTKY